MEARPSSYSVRQPECRGPAVSFEVLDASFCAQLVGQIGLGASRQIGFELILYLVELRNLAIASVLDLDDVPAELGLHRVRELANGQRKGDFGEFRYHLVAGEVAEIAALASARILGVFPGETA